MEPRPNAIELPIQWRQRDRARLDFVQALISRPSMMLRPRTDTLYKEKTAALRNGDDREPTTADEVGALMDDEVLVRYVRFLRRKSQGMKWVSLQAFMEPQTEGLAQWLDEIAQDTGLVELDPDLEVPTYFFTGFHHQPGGFRGNALSGLMYDVGLDISFAGANSGGVSEQVPDRSYARILDLGCGSGRSTEPFKARFPNADVWGIDPSAPLLTAAHKRAAQKGLTINHRQGVAEDTHFPDGHFDLVTATILFHEVPDDAAFHILEEAWRILAPGGLLVIGDLLPYAVVTPYERWYDEWQVVHNNEPFFADAKMRDLAQFCRDAGFPRVEEEHRGRQQFFGDRGRIPGMPYLVLGHKDA